VSPPATSLACAGCGTSAPATAALPAPVRCPRADTGDDVDHVLRRSLDPGRVDYPAGGEENPFLRYRRLLHSWQVAAAHGRSEADWRALVERLDGAVARVDGRGFRVTPCAPADALAAKLGTAAGRLWVKDETGNVSGSHKGRHLLGVLLYLDASGALRPGSRLAIASCGNAALAAAVVSRAAELPLDVFVPPWANAHVVARLRALGARLTVCERRPGETGDPCYRRFREAVAGGAIPFCCQGPDNGLCIEGGATLAWELIDALGDRRLDRIFVQVGGGALASACALGFADAVRLGRIDRAPRLHAVQTAGGHPLARAWDRLAARLLARLPGAPALDPANREAAAGFLAAPERAAAVAAELRHAATHRSEFMWPWESEPRSVATGILDDETYDWLAVVEAMLATGGWPIVVDEATLARANALGTGITAVAADETGTAGLAGLLQALDAGTGCADETLALLFTGARRGAAP
jgi:threonine synthase